VLVSSLGSLGAISHSWIEAHGFSEQPSWATIAHLASTDIGQLKLKEITWADVQFARLCVRVSQT
jgi:hypothetical protein